MSNHAKKTTVGICDTVDGSYVLIGSLVGEIPLPEMESAVEKFMANDATNPVLNVDDEEVGDIELTVGYVDHATQVALEAHKRLERYFEFTLSGGDTQIYYGMINKIGAVTGADSLTPTGTIGIVFSHQVSATAAP